MPPPIIHPKLLSSYQHQQPKGFPKIHQVYKSLNALENRGYRSIKFNYTETRENKLKHNRSRNIWFNPPCSQNVITNLAKSFLNLLGHSFPKSNKLLKIFNRNAVKVSYSCKENMSSIIISHNMKLIKNNATNTKPCHCRSKSTCPLNMPSGRGSNPIFFNKKKVGCLEHSSPPTFVISYYCLAMHHG